MFRLPFSHDCTDLHARRTSSAAVHCERLREQVTERAEFPSAHTVLGAYAWHMHRGEYVWPSPATHAILADLKAGERVFQTLLLTKTMVQRSTTSVSGTILASKHCLISFFPAFNESG